MSNNIEFGITLKANGQGEFVGVVGAAEGAVKRLGSSGTEAGNAINTGANKGREGIAAMTPEIDRLTSGIAKIGHYGSTYLGIAAFSHYAAGVIQAQTAMDRFNSSIAIATGSVKNAAGEFEHIRQLSSHLGLELLTTANAYASFSAAARGTSMEGAKAREVFDAVAGVTAKMGLNAEQGQGVFLALSQTQQRERLPRLRPQRQYPAVLARIQARRANT
jgi:Tape measure protein